MNEMKISKRLTLGFGLVIVIGMAIALLSVWQLRSLSNNLHQVTGERMQKVAKYTAVKDRLNEVARSVRNIIISSDISLRTEEKRKIAESRAEVTEILNTLKTEMKSPKSVEQLNSIMEIRPAYTTALDKVIAQAETGLQTEAGNMLLTEVKPLQEKLFRVVDEARTYQQELADVQATEAGQSANEATVEMVVLFLLMWLVGSAVAILVTRNLMKALGAEPNELAEAVGRVASGDLTLRPRLRSGDTASVMAAVDRMQTSLTDVVSKVRQGSEAVATASIQIAHGNSDLSSRTEAQASALEETAASMEELGSTVKHNADNASQANQLAQNASSVAVLGGQAVSRVVDTMREINDSSRKIADIIAVIDGIAFQTNILALNAAVEAARAGEQGRGFAVVASEVRSLAGRSAEAAKEIKSLITTSVERIGQGSNQVDQAGQTMKEVVDSIRRVTDIVAEISAASAEQSQGVNQVGEAVIQMDHGTQQNASMVEEMAAAAESLKSQAQDLVQAVGVFKVSHMQTMSFSPASAGLKQLNQSRLAISKPPHPPSRGKAPALKVSAPQISRIAQKATAATRPAAFDDKDWETF